MNHAYWMLRNLENPSRGSFSYLDARNFRLMKEEDEKSRILARDLRRDVALSFEKLIELHGFKRKNKDSDVDYSDAINEFDNLMENDKLRMFYQKTVQKQGI